MSSVQVFCGKTYRNLIKPILFTIDAEVVHENMLSVGEFLGNLTLAKKVIYKSLTNVYPTLEQTVVGIDFKRPIGLAAGFDYEAKLTQILPSLGFGFETVGTITNMPYGGNPKPRLGRLPKSKSLMVNKGFKNRGVKAIIDKLSGNQFEFPLGISIGRTNNPKLNQQDSVNDIINAFSLFEKANINNSYYELNISCPNLFGDVSFYPPKNLDQLLTEIDKLKMKKPLFIKMPIEKSDTDTLKMLQVIAKHTPKGVIFGNLQKDRHHPTLIPEEVAKFKVGNFSGKPTFSRSNELIRLAYKHYHNRLVIIGCGGVFSAQDAYTKIRSGATLVQMITGMIFQGPQVVSEINHSLVTLLKRDGFKNIQDAVGIDVK